VNRLTLIIIALSPLSPLTAAADPPAPPLPAVDSIASENPVVDPPGAPPGTDRVANALRRLEREEPDLSQVRARAVEHAGLDGKAERAWARRARWSALLPDLTLRANHGAGEDRDLSRSSSGTERLDVGADSDFDIEARAVWELDRLVFDDVEIRALQAVQRTYRERVQLLGQVSSLYYQRRKLVLGALLAPQTDPYKVALHAIAVAEVSAQLDALTGGYFSRALRERATHAGRRK
jgi:hypothetical protein